MATGVEILNQFYNLCEKGSLKDLIDYVDVHGLTAEDARCFNNLALRSACGHGHFEIVKFLIDRFELTAEDVYCSDELHSPIERHSLIERRYSEVVKYFTKHKMTTDSVRDNGNYSLIEACTNGHLEIAQFLTEKFGLVDEDARSLNCLALYLSCKHGHIETTQWLVDHFGLTWKDLLESVGKWNRGSGSPKFSRTFTKINWASERDSDSLGPKSAAKMR